MLARQKWQVRTIAALEAVFAERVRQHDKHGEAMRELPDGVGPSTPWLTPFAEDPAYMVEDYFRRDYEGHRGAENPDGNYGQLTRMHLVREELAEAFAEHGDSLEFLEEITQVTALLVQWMEYKMEGLDL